MGARILSILVLAASVLLLMAPTPCYAVTSTAARSTTSRRLKGGQRKKGWRRRAQDYKEAKAATTTTFVTNPSSLAHNNIGKGKGKGGEVHYTEKDNDGRTTFVIRCDEENNSATRKAAGGINEKEPKVPPAAGIKARKGKGGGKGGDSGIEPKSEISDPAEDKTGREGSSTSNICDEYEAGDGDDGKDVDGGTGTTDGNGDGSNEMTGGGWYSGDGGSTEEQGGSGAVVEGEVDVVVVPPETSGGDGNDYPSHDTGTGTVLVEEANGDGDSNKGQYDHLHGCEEIGAGNAPTTDPSKGVTVTVDVVHEVESNAVDRGSESILKLMRADLQDNVAPVIADCITGDGAFSPSGSAMVVSSDSGGSGSMSGSGYGTENVTFITNVNFTKLSGREIDCKQYDSYFQPTDTSYKCMLTTIPVDLYYDGRDTSDFEERVQNAIDGHKWQVPGLMMTSTVHRGGSDSSVTAVEADQAQANDDIIGPAGYLTITAAALVLLLLFLMLVRRKRRDEMVKHVSLEDDDDTYMKDIEQESNQSSASLNRLANVVGDDADSATSGWTGASTHFRHAAVNADAMDAMFGESRPSHQDVHVCSSATCEVCERNRQAGVQFIPSGTNLSHAPLPPDAPRQYTAEDTVTL